MGGIVDPDTVILPAVRRLASEVEARSQPGVQHLRARTGEPLEPPVNWTRPARLDCRCAHCTGLASFLGDPVQRTWTLKAAETVRTHVASTAQRCRCDVNLATDRNGRPYSLVCTKNQASYERRAKQRREDLQDLERLA